MAMARRAIFIPVAVALALTAGAPVLARKDAPGPGPTRPTALPERSLWWQAQYAFYNGRYDEAAAQPCALPHTDTDTDTDALAACELRTSALLFQLKRTVEGHPDREAAFKSCSQCPLLVTDFLSATARGQALARSRIAANPSDFAAQFYLGKLDLNYVWLRSGVLGQRKGWSEYREARRSLNAVLAKDPLHVRARVARAWIDYIVGTRVPRLLRWLLGGGSRTRGLAAVREAARAQADFFAHAEAVFALWEMERREQHIPEAVTVAKELLVDFPENEELATFLAGHDQTFQTPPVPTSFDPSGVPPH